MKHGSHAFRAHKNRQVLLVDGRLWRKTTLEQKVDVELENPRGVLPQDFRALIFLEMSHLALDRLRRMGPGALGVRIVVRPEEIIDQVKAFGELQSGRVFLKGGSTVAAEVIAREMLQLGK